MWSGMYSFGVGAYLIIILNKSNGYKVSVNSDT